MGIRDWSSDGCSSDLLTARDVDLARTSSAIAAELEVPAEPVVANQLEIAIDARDIAAVRPFWEAVLGYRSDEDDEVVDPFGRGPAFWFQQMDEPRPQRSRIHIDVTVPHAAAAERNEAALAAGGTLVSEAGGQAFWVLAGPEGTQAYIWPWHTRD